jgi:hypothetical protein
VIEEKRVAGFDATVLTARSGHDLAAWLKENGYAHSPEVAKWAEPYLGGEWHFTALKVAKDESDRFASDVKAAALRISFDTERPLFPYREPDSKTARKMLDAPERLLRMYFISDARYRGQIEGGQRWSGILVWSGNITPHRDVLLHELGLPLGTGSEKWWLTEFEDQWPYAEATGDLYFSKDPDQAFKTRETAVVPKPSDAGMIACFLLASCMPLRRVWRAPFPRRTRR